MKTKIVRSFQILDHGWDNSQSFQGCGLAFTLFDDIATGCGNNPREALNDALESLAQNDWDTSAISDARIAELSDVSDIPAQEDEDGNPSEDQAEECYHYVSVRVSEQAGLC